ncbi:MULTISPECIES: MraY family glycosyltransferase [Clostridia]|uniref:glycosyltransferase family 4 protein n=1 Tax=Clostridia TaxID=186801 RepID=UPI000EA202E0|nr:MULTISPECIES: MraY family glycosyltransferase [Clostridia]NBJ68814.1 undecaprenyl/decaprenyl-phosphate alpha-N-acetylglucosaminyl 1-phosphate transferase [Roseburia sp. 1XD42-34]RKI80193.1 undecaprenyl/decaprenyl-phosphate alpha-N-acetylglucosaminyl 1-phosphate transferase [Clostridium sp. 1xD42-85]
MLHISEWIIAFIISMLTALLVTPIIKKLAFCLKAIDKPDNNRKNHDGDKASLGGLAIFIGAVAGFLYLQPEHPQMSAIIIGAMIMLLTGLIDDIFELKPYYKLFGQITAAVVVVSSGLVIEKLTIPFLGTVYLEGLAFVITIIWIVGASNAINLIDGLDGLAAGVSAIGLSSILVMAVMDYRVVVAYLCIVLIGSCLGFLYHNFYPAKIFMGDTGALFLGYSIAIVSMMGLFKNVAFFSFIIPIIVIAIPIFDTTLAIIRRIINQQGIATADKQHIHYQLVKMGYSHRTAVLIIYAFSIFFGLLAISFNSSTLLASSIIFIIALIGIQVIAELAGIVLKGKQPIIGSMRKVLGINKTDQIK